MIAASENAARVWDRFCERFGVVEGSVPLFAEDPAGCFALREIGRGETRRPVLARSREMEALVLAETTKLVEDWRAKAKTYDGLIYCMGWREGTRLLPLYIGKAATLPIH